MDYVEPVSGIHSNSFLFFETGKFTIAFSFFQVAKIMIPLLRFLFHDSILLVYCITTCHMTHT